MGVSAQQHRVSTGLHNSRSCVSPGAVTCWIPWLYMWRVLSVALDAARFWSYFCFYTAFFLVGLVLIHDCCHMEAVLGTPTNHPSIYPLLGILDLYLHSNIRNRLHLGPKSTFIVVLFLFSLFTTFFLNLSLILISNFSLANPGPKGRRLPGIKKLTCFYQNIQGFVDPGKGLTNPSPVLNVTKLSEFHAYVYDKKPDIICLTETWLWGEFGDGEILPANTYKLFRLDRSRKTHPMDPDNPKKFREKGGGVLIAVRADLDAESKVIVSSCKAELLSVELDLGEKEFLVVSNCYRVGTLGDSNFAEIEKQLLLISKKQKYKRHVLVGDFNLNSVTWEVSYGITSSRLESKFLELFDNNGFGQCVDKPTHSGGRTLDLVLSNSNSLVKNLKVLPQFVGIKSDHFAIEFDIAVKAKRLKSKKRKILNFKKADWKAIGTDLRRVGWDKLLNSVEPEVAWNRFKEVLHKICDQHIPTVTIKSEFQPPWFDSDVHKACLEKENKRKRYVLTGNPEHYASFSDSRRNFKRLVEKKKLDNISDDNDPSLIPKKFWSYVKSSSNSHRIPETMSYGNRFRNDIHDQTELFNEYFHDQFSEPSEYNIPISWEDDNTTQVDFSPEKVLKLLRDINPNKAHGPDKIHGTVLKNCAHSLAYPLAVLFKTSYLTGHIPLEWKLANVVPVYKKGSKASVENYRPISLTCLCMKLMEWIVREEVMRKCQHLISPEQHGFLPGKSCTTQMVGFADSLASSINDAARTDVVYFDFAKAFDSVSHDVLLYKLKTQFGIDGTLLKFIKNYLEGRKQRVVIGGLESGLRTVNSGVPQGSILGPLLFVLFINDMHKSVSPGTNIALYADDTKIWRKIVSYMDHIILQRDISALLEWSRINKMTFHPDKCKVVKVTLQVERYMDKFPYFLGEKCLDYADVEKDLGVKLVPRLCWNEHCQSLISSARSRLGLTKRTCHFIKNRRQRLIMYKTMVRSLFQHCAEIWRPSTKVALSKFEAVQKRAVKWIFMQDHEHYSEQVYQSKLIELDLLPMEQRFVYGDLKLFHKIINRETSVELPDYLELIAPEEVMPGSEESEARRLRTSHKDPLYFVCTIEDRVNVFRHSYFYRAHLLWNRLPLSVRLVRDCDMFSVELRKHLAMSTLPEVEPD